MGYKPKYSKKVALNNLKSQCARKEYCIRDIRERLLLWNMNEADIEEIIKTLNDNKYIDEKRYAYAVVNDKLKFNKWGKNKIRYFLINKGLTKVIIDEAIESINADEYIKILRHIIRQKQPTIKAKNNYEHKIKLLNFITSRGFETNLAMDIINKLFNE